MEMGRQTWILRAFGRYVFGTLGNEANISPLNWGRGHLPPDSLVPPQIQKLADRSDVISEVPKCSKIKTFRGSAPPRTPLGELTALRQTPDGQGVVAPVKNPTLALGPSGLVSTGLKVSNPLELATLLMIDFKGLSSVRITWKPEYAGPPHLFSLPHRANAVAE